VADVSSTGTWDALFNEFYLRAYASDERDAEAGAQALAAVRRLLGFREIEIRCGLKRATLSSHFFTSDQEFDRLLAVLESKRSASPSRPSV
jgi:hypothetical protein